MVLNYKVFVTDEAINDIIDLVRYISVELLNPEAAGSICVACNERFDELVSDFAYNKKISFFVVKLHFARYIV